MAALKIPGTSSSTGGSQVSNLLGGNKGTGATTGQITMAPFRAAKSVAAPKLTTSAPKATSGKIPSGKTPGAAPISASDRLANQIATGTFGLNTSAKGGYNPFATPSQASVNQQILQQARSQYLPQLQTIQGNIGAENTANPQRVSDIKSIYGTYGTQAQNAFNQTKNALTSLLQQTRTGDQTAQNVLGAALNSANVPGQTLDQMMGITAPQGAPASPYLAAAEAQGTGVQNELAQAGTGLLGTVGQGITNAGLERAQQLDTESLRHQAALQGYTGQLSALAQQVPSDIATARTAVNTQLQNAATTNLQNRLAQQTFGLNKQQQQFNQEQTAKVNSANIANQGVQNAQNWARIKQGNTQLAQNAQSIQASIDSTNAKTIQSEAKLEAGTANNMAKTIQSYFTPTKEMIYTTSTKSQPKKAGQQPVTTRTTHVNTAAYEQAINPAELVGTLQSQYGVSREQALQAIQNQPQFYGTNPNQSVGQWAREQLWYMGVPGYGEAQQISAQRNQSLQAAAAEALRWGLSGRGTLPKSWLNAYQQSRNTVGNRQWTPPPTLR